MSKYKNLILLVTAIIGTVIGYNLGKLFLDITLVDYILIELIISLFHYLYNSVKRDIIKQEI